MNYTTNYHLPQWVETDRIMMEDFNQAMADIDAGIKTISDAAYTPDNKPYVVGSYTGSVGNSQTINLGFRPSMVIVSGESRYDEAEDVMKHTAVITVNGPGGVSSLTNSGFEVMAVPGYLPYLNATDRRYRYIAFR